MNRLKQVLAEHGIWIAIITVACLPAVWPLFKPGFFLTQDADTLIIRLGEFHRMLRDGQFPVRYGTIINHAWGYPAFNFLYPLPMMTMEAFRLIGFGLIDSTKYWLITATVLSAIGMYIWVRSFLGVKAAIPAAVLYVYAPYRFVDLYVRGSIGEITAFVFLPYIAWAIERLARTGRLRYVLVASFGWAFLILAHNTLAFLFAFFFLFWLVWWMWGSRYRKLLASVPVLMLLLTTWFWLPIALEAKYVQFNPVSVFRDHYIYPIQLVWSYQLPLGWGYEGSDVSIEHDRMSFQIGIVPWIAIITAFFIRHTLARIFLVIIGIHVFLMLPWSDHFWKLTQIEDFFQFPFRILSMIIFLASVLWGWVLKNKQWWMVGAATIFSMLVTLPYAKPGHYHDVPATDGFYATNDGTTTITDEFMPRVVKEKLPPRVYREVDVLQGEGTIAMVKQKTNDIIFTTQSSDDLFLRINTIDYPGWRASIDGQTSAIRPNERWGFIEFGVPKGLHEVRVWFSETPSRLFADAVSLATLLGLGVGVYKWRGAF